MKISKLQKMPEIRHVMTPFPHWIEPDTSALEAQQMMAVHGIRHLPVMAGGRLVGVVSERDLRHLLGRGAGSPAATDSPVGDLCDEEPYMVDTHQRLDEVLRQMGESHIEAALVLKEGRLAGIFTVTDACKAFREILRSRYPSTSGDDEAA